MKNYLAVFFGKSDAMEAWKALPESERKDREQAGMAAWHKWVADHNGVISEMGSPLGKTKRADKNGMSDTRNELCAWTVVKANSQEEATRLFLNHPHFTIFPGDHIEVMECLPVPGMA
ncbi:hypothetical protein RLW55_02300 [Hyphomicrobium sp. B1]|uniref:hypothetical protein n=1 Tax=unclassified Hyphomicrobium TaxID=2619925 RepID=UPI000213F934|nr:MULTISPECIES: hypothetical protein [unclassified Hyphomicrobium]CCB63654.1 conserved protein of unknown function [Hyphomicrobium sp. MC1]